MRKPRTASLDSSDDRDNAAPLPAPASADPSPFTLAARTEDAERIAAALQSLEPIYREVLVLRFQEELSLQEIATIVAAPVPTVASRIYRALAALRPQFAADHTAGDPHAH
jgi:RNA polymerase sigma-70 factor (ECF subfamily)